MKLHYTSLSILLTTTFGLAQITAAQGSVPPGPTTSPDGKLVGAWTQFVPGAATTALRAPTLELRFVVQATVSSAGTIDGAGYCGKYALAYTKSDGTTGLDTGLTVRTNPMFTASPLPSVPKLSTLIGPRSKSSLQVGLRQILPKTSGWKTAQPRHRRAFRGHIKLAADIAAVPVLPCAV